MPLLTGVRLAEALSLFAGAAAVPKAVIGVAPPTSADLSPIRDITPPAVAGVEVAKGTIRATASEDAVVVEAGPSVTPPEVAVVALSLNYKK